MLEYPPGSAERGELKDALERHGSQVTDIPIVIGDEEIRTNDVHYQVEVRRVEISPLLCVLKILY